jgi:hypothetical protein
MVIWVKTTIDIADGILMEAKQRARREGTTLRALVERGLSRELSESNPSASPFEPVTGRLDPLPGTDPYSDWEGIRDSIYGGQARD